MKLYKCTGKYLDYTLYEYYGKGKTDNGDTFHVLINAMGTTLCSDSDFKQYFEPIKGISKVDEVFKVGQKYSIEGRDFVVVSMGYKNIRLICMHSWYQFQDINLYNKNINEYFSGFDYDIKRIK